MGFPLEFCIGAGVSENWNDGAFRWSKKFSDMFSRFDTIPECDGHSATQPASQPRCRSYYAQRSGVEPNKTLQAGILASSFLVCAESRSLGN